MTSLCKGVVNYLFDPLDRLVVAHSAKYFYNDARLSALIQDNRITLFFRSAEGLLAELTPSEAGTLLATDLQSSVVHALKSGQSRSIVYNVYGFRALNAGIMSVAGFNGELPDPVTGHYLLGNGYRAYNPVLLRFNSPDTMSPFGKGGVNAYAYCEGDPVNFADPSGYGKWSRLLGGLFSGSKRSKKANKAIKVRVVEEVTDLSGMTHSKIITRTRKAVDTEPELFSPSAAKHQGIDLVEFKRLQQPSSLSVLAEETRLQNTTIPPKLMKYIGADTDALERVLKSPNPSRLIHDTPQKRANNVRTQV
ncbi:hypothetical protein CJF35_05860 [Pseudomonas lundensis]|uniref:RHS repeat-associated core domain-containing protein n=1 Tax=Pseudomonas lundensis TaxID=86185 RepID=UPI000BA21FC7|nr:RHS repeat-associated core domain-containing protein [Pseudomonas lundensis]OZY37894.1 hypothetical protein CJF35_05860 [Pseudomonas lundensis]